MVETESHTVVIYAYECAPYHRPSSTIGAQRPFQFAKHLPKYGWQAIVLCCNFKRRNQLDPNGNWKVSVEEIVSNSLCNWDRKNSLVIPLPSLKYADKIDRLWQQQVSMNEKDGTFSAKPGFFRSLTRRGTSLLKLFRGDHSQSWQAVAVYAHEVLVKLGVNIEMQIAEHGPDASVFIASKVNQSKGTPWIIDFRDPVLLGKTWLAAVVLRPFLRNMGRTCSGIINVNSIWTKLDQQLFKRIPCHTIPNGYDEEEFKLLSYKTIPNELVLYYFGGVKEGQSFRLLFKAMELLRLEEPDCFNRILFKYNGPSKNKVLLEQEELCPSLRSEIDGPLMRAEVLELASQSDLLILLSKRENTPFHRQGFYPGKAFEYLGLNKFIVVIPPDGGLLDQLISKTEAGISFDSVPLLADFLRKSTDLKISGQLISIRPKKSLEAFNRESQTGDLATILDNTLSR